MKKRKRIKKAYEKVFLRYNQEQLQQKSNKPQE